jgi:hypothetical protein
MQYISTKLWYPPTRLQGIIDHNIPIQRGIPSRTHKAHTVTAEISSPIDLEPNSIVILLYFCEEQITQIQILCNLNLSNVISKFRMVAMFVILT